jgi:hypothetical protein
MATSADNLRATMEATMIGFIDSHTAAVKHKDQAALSSYLTADCTRHLRPATFPATYNFIKAVETNAEYEARMTQEMAAMDDTRATILTSTIDTVARKGSVHSEHWTKIGATEFTMEICWFLDFSADGTRVCKIVEFVDTLTSAKMVEQMGLGK